MTKRRSRSCVLFALPLLAAIPVLAQTNRYSTDCEAARQALQINNPVQLAPCQPSTSAAPTVPALTNKQMVQMQVASTLVDAFVNMLFSSDSQANAQKQKMMAELQARQAEAERQKQHEEAMRLAAICNRLQATLKLSGLPQLQLKGSGQGTEGLRLKLGVQQRRPRGRAWTARHRAERQHRKWRQHALRHPGSPGHLYEWPRQLSNRPVG